MNIGITGATGFIGSRVAQLAREGGHRVIAYSRHPARSPQFDECRAFSLETLPDLSELDAIVHLAGETIMGRWTTGKKQRIRDSRVQGTLRVAESLQAMGDRAPTFVCGSAIGYYGDTADHIVDESSPAGDGFLAEVTTAWEQTASLATNTRIAFIRTGLVLGRNGGAMRLIGPVFRAGLGGRLGNGCQWVSAIHVDDVAGIILHAAENPNVSGPLNAVMPESVRNIDFTRALARAAHRPAIFPAPAFALKLALGELAHVLLDSQRVFPAATLDSGYRFRFPTMEAVATDVIRPD
jgi:hypothetical protein